MKKKIQKLLVQACAHDSARLVPISADSVEEMAEKLVKHNTLSFEPDEKTKAFSKKILEAMSNFKMREHIAHHLKDRPVLQTPKRLMDYANRLDEALHSDGEEFLPWKALFFMEQQIEQLWKDSQLFKTISDFEQPDQDPRRWGWHARENPQLYKDEEEKPMKKKRVTKAKTATKKKDTMRPIIIVSQKPGKKNGAATKKQAAQILPESTPNKTA